MPLLAYFGHHKSGTVWINAILKWVARAVGLRHAVTRIRGTRIRTIPSRRSLCE